MKMPSRQLTETVYSQKLVFIVNPNASNKGSIKIWKKIERELAKNGKRYEVFFTERSGHAKELTEQILKQSLEETLICGVGGDGTIHEIMNGAAAFPHAIISSIPAGSGNDYARGLQKTTKVHKALSLILQGQSTSEVDLGCYTYQNNKHYFINSLGIGLDAEIANGVNKSRWKKWFNTFKAGKLIYLYFFFKKLFTFKPFELHTEIDGKTYIFKNTWFLVAANQGYFGGGIKISPDSATNDGKLNIIVVREFKRFELLFMFATVFLGKHLKLKNVDSFLCERIFLRADSNVFIQADGEIVGNREITAEISPRMITIVAGVGENN